MNIPDRLLFGQFLIEKKKLDKPTLDKALQIQKADGITDHPRMLGAILINDFDIFKNRVELQRYLKEFEVYKENLRDIYITAKTYGESPDKKLEQEYADLMEELETAPTIKIRDLIKMIEKFKIAIKQIKKKDDEIAALNQKLDTIEYNKNKEISLLKQQIQEFKMANEKQLKRIDNIKQLKNRNK